MKKLIITLILTGILFIGSGCHFVAGAAIGYGASELIHHHHHH